MCISLKACGTKAVEDVNRKLKTLPDILDQTTEFVATKGKEVFNAGKEVFNAGCCGLIKCRPPCFLCWIFPSVSPAHKNKCKMS